MAPDDLKVSSAHGQGLLSGQDSPSGISIDEQAVLSRETNPHRWYSNLCQKPQLGFNEIVELCVSFSVLIAGAVLDQYLGDPRQRPIPYQYLESTGDYIVNQNFDFPYHDSTVSSAELLLFGAFLPAVIQLLLSFFRGAKGSVQKTLCVYLLGFGLTMLLTNALKLYVGYFRPAFYDLCEPDDNYEECTSGNEDARKSFPSGHASGSFCGLSLLSFYLEGVFGVSQLRVWKVDTVSGKVVTGYRRPLGLSRIVSIFCYAPMLVAGFIAASRVVDNKHFPADVVGGSVLGTTIALLVHSIWFPSFPTSDD